ncbi:hypothetical protein [Salinigranum sp. GCM10025319]|uniref:hypothetical protein n=1 Tax=Salinigranum sp. GCM10025319 TaxID=3252687 RepID=UPI0036203F9C
MTEISLPDELTEQIENRIQHTDFESVDEYAAFVLSEVVTRADHGTAGADESAPSRAEVQNRLKSLGYLEE